MRGMACIACSTQESNQFSPVQNNSDAFVLGSRMQAEATVDATSYVLIFYSDFFPSFLFIFYYFSYKLRNPSDGAIHFRCFSSWIVTPSAGIKRYY